MLQKLMSITNFITIVFITFALSSNLFTYFISTQSKTYLNCSINQLNVNNLYLAETTSKPSFPKQSTDPGGGGRIDISIRSKLS
jgi:hypothetical protein